MRLNSRTLISFLSLALLLGCTSLPSRAQEQEVPAEALADFTAPLEKLTVSSCSDQKTPQILWGSIVKEKSQIFAHLGDTIYAVHPSDRPFDKAYSLMFQDPQFQVARKELPMLVTWDDNDYGQRDGGKSNPDKLAAREALLKAFPQTAQQIAREQEGLYYSVDWGPQNQRVRLVFLDTRWFRDDLEKNEKPKGPLDLYQPTKDTSKTLLGEAQWKWLSEELQKPADLILLFSSIQVLSFEHGFEKWNNFPHERDRLLRLISDSNKKVVIFSGDRHQGEVSQLKLANGETLFDITASGINKGSTLKDEQNSLRRGEKTGEVNYALAQIDWALRNLKIDLKSDKGVVQSLNFGF